MTHINLKFNLFKANIKINFKSGWSSDHPDYHLAPPLVIKQLKLDVFVCKSILTHAATKLFDRVNSLNSQDARQFS